jgi:hypothetical protein
MGYNNLTNIVGTAGELLGLNETGRSEALARGDISGAVWGSPLTTGQTQTQPAVMTNSGSYNPAGYNTVVSPLVPGVQYPTPQPTQTTGGGTKTQPQQTSNGLTLRQQMEKGLIPWDDNKLNAGGSGSGPSQPDLEAYNAVYDPSMGYLNTAESNLRSDYPNALTALQNQYDTSGQLLSNQNLTAGNQLSTSSTSALNRKEDALSAARRLYDELRRGYQQRFGGATSAGGAASEISSVEQQRQMGATQRSYGDTMANLEYQKADLQRNYATATMKLKYDLDSAKNQANSDFTSKLLQIQSSKAQVESTKAAAKLDALNQYRNQLFSISQSNAQFQQTLELQRNAAQYNIDAMTKQAGLTSQNASSALASLFGNTSTNPNSPLTIGSSQGQNTQQMTGKIFKGKYDAQGNPVYE